MEEKRNNNELYDAAEESELTEEERAEMEKVGAFLSKMPGVPDPSKFVGTHVNEEKLRRYERLAELARMWERRESDVSAHITPPVNTARSKSMFVEMEPPYSSMDRTTQDILICCLDLADDFCMTCTEDGMLRLSFGVKDIWRDESAVRNGSGAGKLNK